MIAHDARQQRIFASNVRWRAIFALLAIAVPALLFALFRRQELRLRALAEQGRPGTATITEVTRQGSALYSHYAYSVDGVTYTWSVSRADAPYDPGASFPITFLPEDPSLSRPVVPYTREHLDAELNLPVRRGFPAGAFALFAGAALLCHRAVRRTLRGVPPRTRPLLSADAAGRLVAALLLAVVLAVSFDPKVRAVQIALMGPSPLGVPAVVVASAAQAVLFAPLFWVMPHLMRIVLGAVARGDGVSKLGIVLAVAMAPPELRRSRAVVLGGAVYFAALLAGWIALTAARGV